MSKNVTESVFNTMNNMHDLYPTLDGVKYFDLHRKHLFYGRIDREGDAIYLDHMKISEIYGGPSNTHFAANFVSDAFGDLRLNIKKAGSAIDRNSLYQPNMRIHKSRSPGSLGDLEYNYNAYINKMYSDYVNTYLSIDRRHEKISDYRSFIKSFMGYILRIANQFPITKTGYMLSNHCSPFVSGLMVEVSSELHGTQNNSNVIKYINDPNYSSDYIVKQAQKYGFMIDKNAPWRFVFNVFSGALQENTLTGGKIYLQKYGLSHQNVFKFCYRKTHLEDLNNINNLFYSLYDNFYTQFSTYEVQSFLTDQSGKCNKINVRSSRYQRSGPSSVAETDKLVEEYWLKVLLKLRMVESGAPHTAHNFSFYIKKMLSNYRMFGSTAALNYINDLTKGLEGIKFITKGTHWYGLTEKEYYHRKRAAAMKRLDPDTVQYSVTGTNNIVK